MAAVRETRSALRQRWRSGMGEGYEARYWKRVAAPLSPTELWSRSRVSS